MNGEPKTSSVPFSFQVSQAEIGPFSVDLLKVRPDERSPLKAAIANYTPGSAKVSQELRAMSEDQTVRKAIQIVARPELIMENRNGGGVTILNFFTACATPSIDKQAFAVILPSFQGAYLFQLFDSPWLYLAWWLNLYATNPQEPVPNFIPPPIRLEPLVYLLHAIDAYRRCAFVSQLSFAPNDAPSITSEAYTETLQQSVKSADLRWLLPAFLSLTPNVDLSEFDEDPMHFEPLVQLEFLLPGKDAINGNAAMSFGEAGRSMGIEFYRSWFQGIGFELSVRSGIEWETLQRGFLAPTGLANHLILTEMEQDGTVVFNHQAMNREALEYKLSRIMADSLSFSLDRTAGLPGTRGKGEPSSEPLRVEETCPSCSAAVNPGQKFCINCGTPLSVTKKSEAVQQRFCPECGSAIKHGSKFCTSCGTRITS